MATKVASIYADVGLQGLDKSKTDLAAFKGEIQKTGGGLTDLTGIFGKVGTAVTGLTGGVAILGGTFKAALELGKQGAALEQTENRFKRLSASIGSTADVLESRLYSAMGGMMSKAEMMSGATDIISLGLAKDEDSVVRLATLVGKLGWDMNQVILTFANQSTMRLDQLGLSVTDVTSKWNQFKAAGMESTAAFNLAVIEAGEEKLRLLGDTVETSAGSFKRFEAATADVSDKIKSALTPTLADAAEAAALLLTWNDKIGAATQTQARAVEKSATSYEEYVRGVLAARSAITGYIVPANEVTRILAELATGSEEAARTFRVQTPAAWNLANGLDYVGRMAKGIPSQMQAAASSSQIYAKASEAVVEVALRQKAAQESLADVYNKSTTYALQLADSNKRLADKEKELADLGKEISAQGPVRTRIDQDKTLNANELALAQARLKVVTEDLGSAKKKEGETDAEYNLRLVEMRNTIGELTGKMGEHTLIVGGATKEQLAHRDALIADIEAMKAQAKEMEGREMIKALDARKLGAEAYAQAVAQINDVYDLFTDQELKAATSHEILITALSDATGLHGAQQAIIDYYKSIGDAYGALMALIAAGQNVTGDYAGGHAEAMAEGGGGASPPPTNRRARGGPVTAGASYIVGERGPELFQPGQSGNVYNANRTWNVTVQSARAMALILAQAEREQRHEAARSM